MIDPLAAFEEIVRAAHTVTQERDATDSTTVPDAVEVQEAHPFESRNIHPDLPGKVRTLFDDGHFPEATFAAFKFVETRVKKASNIRGANSVGFSLMMQAFDEKNPVLKLNAMSSDSEIDEQRGFRHIFAGAQAGIRNPRGHDTDIDDGPDTCLDHLAVASVLMRTMDAAGL